MLVAQQQQQQQHHQQQPSSSSASSSSSSLQHDFDDDNGILLSHSPPRSESMAYPVSKTGTLISKIQFALRQNSAARAVMATIAFVAFLLIITSDFLHDSAARGSSSLRASTSSSSSSSYFFGSWKTTHWGGSIHQGYFREQDVVDASNKNMFHFAAVTDMDQLSKIENGGKLAFRSWFQPGTLIKTKTSKGTVWYDIRIDSGQKRELVTKHNEAGRGAEFSELTLYQNRLLTFDDRTGDVFEILNRDDGTDSYVAPRFVITEGPGDTDKGMKWEWSTVKDGELIMGSMGKEYTNREGQIVNVNNLWVAILDRNGLIRREDWSRQYAAVRRALHATAPGYVIIEAANWSDRMQRWVFLPRRISSEPYDDVEDERRGGNKLVLLDRNFNDPNVVTVQFQEPRDTLRGFSSFAFVPNSNDRHALAVQSVEEDCALDDLSACKQRSYFFVFDVRSGKIISDTIQYDMNVKYEGIEFVNIFTKPPPPPSS